MWFAVMAAMAQAQDDRFDGQVFRPSSDSEVTVWTEDTHTAPDGTASVRAYVQYAHAPVRWTGDDGDPERLVSDLFGVDLLGAVRWRQIRLGVHLPAYLVAAGAAGDTEPGLGDVAFDLKGTLLDRDAFPVGVAVMGRIALPTASVDVPLGAESTGWELLGIADRTFGPVTVAANVGTRGVPRAEYDDLVWNDQVFGRIGGGWRLTEDVGASAELAAQTNWSSGQNPAGSAVEAMGGGWAWLADGIVARGGLGIGLTRAPGAPAMRLVVGVSYEPNPTPDRDHDGLANKADRCPSDPEDPDDYADADGCPDPSYTTEIRLVGRDGATVDGSVTLAGPQSVSLDPGDRFVAVHPGTYAVTAAIPGYERYTGEIVVPARQGERFALTLVADDGALRVWAVDPAGNPVPAAVLRVSGGEAQPADGDAIPLPPGEHAVVVTADGFTAAAASVAITGGETRELSVVLVPTPPGPAPQPVSAPGG